MAEVGIEVGVYRFDDPFTLVDVLHERVSPAFLEEIKASGGGDITLSLHDSKVSADPTLIDYRNILRFKVAGRVVGGMLIGKKTLTIIDEDTEDEVHKVSGEGFRAWLNDAATYPAGGLKKTSYETRAFNFASERGEWYDPDQWTTPVNVAKWGDIVGSPWRYAPAQWPDVPNAYWVWSQDSFSTSPAGDNFFRYEFETTEDKKHSLFLAADDQFSVYIDGQPTTQSDPASSAYSEVTRVDFDLKAGSHVVGIRVTNKEPGPAALLAALFSYTEPIQVEVIGAVTLPNGTAVNCTDHGLSVGDKVFFLTNGELPTGVSQGIEYFVKSVTNANSITISATAGGAAISTSGTQSGVHTLNRPEIPAAATLISYTGQAGWLVAGYPDPVPGWSPGEIVHTLLEEAETRGVSFPLWLTPTFTATEDSYGNVWDRDLDWEFGVGSSLSSVISKLEELVCDVWIDPETLELNMAKERGVDRSVPQLDVDGITVLSGPIIFEKGKNLGKSEVDGVGEIANALVITTSDGWLAVDDTSGSISKYGRIEAHLDTGVSETVSTAVASTVFEHKANPEVGASYEVIPTPGHVPFVDFNVGDWVIAPNDIGLGVKRRVVSIAVEEDEAGNPLYSVEFDTIFQDNEDKLSDWLKKLGGGALGGQFANSGGGSSSPIGVPNVVPPAPGSSVTRIPLAPENVEAASRGLWSINGVDVFSEVTVTWNAVTSNTDGTPTVPAVYEVWGHLTENSDNTYELFATTPDNTATFRPFEAGSNWTFRVRALNSANAVGSYSDAIEHTMEAPTEPMLAPSDPTLSSSKGVLIVTWDGLMSDDMPPPPQFRYVYALVSLADQDTFLQMGSVLQRGGGTISIPGLDIDESYDVKLVAVDGTGILSPETAVGTVTITGITGPDIVANSITGNEIDVGSITVQHLAAGVGGELDLTANTSIQFVVGEQLGDIQDTVSDTVDELETLQTYYTFGVDGAEITKPGSPFSVAIRSDRIEMLENGNVVSYWNSGQMHVASLVGEEVILGNHKLEKYGTGTVVRTL